MSVKTCEIHTGPVRASNDPHAEPYDPCGQRPTYYYVDRRRGVTVYTCTTHMREIRARSDYEMYRVRVSGRSVPESERGTTRVVLRLAPEAAEDLETLAEREGASKAAVVARLVEREMAIRALATKGSGR